MKMKNLVIFDCDGVLVDSEQIANQALVDCLADLQIVMSVAEATRSFRGRKLAESLTEIEETKGCTLPESFETELRQRMSEYFESRLKPINGAVDAVRRILHLKCVASNGPLQKTKRNLEITGLHHHFAENIFSAYTLQKWKPDPDLFLHACEKMGSDPSHSVVVEDSESGIQAALAGGFKVLAFGFQTTERSDVIPFKEMSELPALIDRVFAIETL